MTAVPPHVMVVDDDEITRIYLARQLRQYGLQVTAVETGQRGDRAAFDPAV